MQRIGDYIRKNMVQYSYFDRNNELKTDQFDIQEFFFNPVAYYPGCGDDGFLIEKMNSTFACRHFVYIDYSWREWYMLEGFQKKKKRFSCRGYDLVRLDRLRNNEFSLLMYKPTVIIDSIRRSNFSQPEKFFLLATFVNVNAG
jgi:hypothetical protein